MKPIRLSIKGLNSFIEEQVIDFESLIEHGLFGVFGPTGSGKSTILDGITIALYGKTSRDSANYINTQCDQMQVVFDFKIKTQLYRVTRTFKRNKHDSINAAKPTRLTELTELGEVVLEEQTKLVNQKCFEIIGLKFEDFVRTVVLPQGKFSEFIKLKGKERREMLERLFSLNRFGDDLTRKLQHVMKVERDKQFVLTGELKGFEDISKEKLSEKESEKSNIAEQLHTTHEAVEKQTVQVKTSQLLFDKINKQTLLKDQLAVFLEQADVMNSNRIRLDVGRKLINIKPHYELYKETEEKIRQNTLENVELKNTLITTETTLEKTKEQRDESRTLYENTRLKNQTIYHQISEGLTLQSEISAHQTSLDAILKHESDVLIKQELMAVEIQTLKEKAETLEKDVVIENEIMTSNQTTSEERKLIESGYLLELEQNRFKTQQPTLMTQIQQIEDQIKSNEQQLEHLNNKEQSLQENIQSLKNDEQIDRETYLVAHEDLIKIKQEHVMKAENHQKLTKEQQLLESQLTIHQETMLQLDLEYADYLKAKENIYINALQEKLIDDEACPVCGSLEHHPVRVEGINVHFDEENYQKHKVTIETLSHQRLKNELQLKECSNYDVHHVDETLKTLTASYDRFEQNELLQRELKINHEKTSEVKEVITSQKSGLENQLETKETLDLQVNNLNHQLVALKIESAIKNFTENRTAQLKKDQTYESAQKRQKTLISELESDQSTIKTLEKTYQTQKSELMLSLTEKDHLLDAIKTKEEKLTLWFGDNRDLNTYLSTLKMAEQKVSDQLDHLEKSSTQIQEVYNTKQKRLNELSIMIKEASDRKIKHFETYKSQLVQHGLSEEALLAFEDDNERLTTLEASINTYDLEKQAVSVRLKDLDNQIGEEKITESLLKDQVLTLEHLTTEHKQLNTMYIELGKDVEDLKVKLKDLSDLLDKQSELEHKMSLLTDLDKLFKGKKFVEFVATYQLRYVAIEASKRLNDITSGKYGLEVDDTGQFMIRDYSYGGVIRDTTTLSGGETFLVSLALALSLSTQIQLKGTAPLELFFLDEGFGTLDENFLEVVMSSLERVHNEYLSIGLISHVESIKNRVPIKLNVVPSESGSHGSQVKVERT